MLGWKGGPNTNLRLFLAQFPFWKLSWLWHQHCPFDLTKLISNVKSSFHAKKTGIWWYLLSYSLASKGKQMPSRQHLYSCALPAYRRYLSYHILIGLSCEALARGRAAVSPQLEQLSLDPVPETLKPKVLPPG